MENEHVLSGLIRKRAEVAGQLGAAQAHARELALAPGAIDTTIRMFDPTINPDAIRPKQVKARHIAFRGEVSRMIFSTIRDSPEPPTCRDIAVRVVESRGMDVDDDRLVSTVSKRLRSTLRDMRDRGVIRSFVSDGNGLVWGLGNAG
jgi:hypothetical protein